MIKVCFKKALYAWQAQQITDDQEWAILGRAPSHSCIWTAKLPPATSISTKTSRIGVTVRWDPWKVHLFVSKVQKLLHNLYTIGVGENRSFPQLKEHREEGVYSHKTEVLPKKQREKNQKKWCMQKRQNLCFAFYSWQKNAQLLLSFDYWQSNDNMNSACSNNNPWKLTILTHSTALWDPGCPSKITFS